MRKAKPKRVVIISDLHSGHVVGLTPPEFEIGPISDHDKKLKALRRIMWDFYAAEIKKLQPIDLLVVNGDAVEGKGERSGGTELITTDRDKQTMIAAACIDVAAAPRKILIYGTDSHTGKDEDWEDVLRERTRAEKIGAHEWVDVNGLVFDFKHHSASSSVPHGRHTSAARERAWNILWALHEEAPLSDVIIRSHVHYFNYCGGYNWLGMTTPALQGLGSKYGARRCSGTVDFGFISFDVESKEKYSWQPHIVKIKQHSSVIKI